MMGSRDKPDRMEQSTTSFNKGCESQHMAQYFKTVFIFLFYINGIKFIFEHCWIRLDMQYGIIKKDVGWKLVVRLYILPSLPVAGDCLPLMLLVLNVHTLSGQYSVNCPTGPYSLPTNLNGCLLYTSPSPRDS